MHAVPVESTEKLERVSRLLRTDRELPAKLDTVVDMARRSIVNCDGAGVSLVIQGTPTTGAATGPLVFEVDEIQYRTGEGPCQTSVAARQVVRIDLRPGDGDCSRFATEAAEAGVSSALSIPLMVGGRAVGALNLYSTTPGAFDERSERSAAVIAEYAAEVVATSALCAPSLEMVQGLQEPPEAREVIAEAIATLKERRGCSDELALAELRDQALTCGAPLSVVAKRFVERAE